MSLVFQVIASVEFKLWMFQINNKLFQERNQYASKRERINFNSNQ